MKDSSFFSRVMKSCHASTEIETSQVIQFVTILFPIVGGHVFTSKSLTIPKRSQRIAKRLFPCLPWNFETETRMAGPPTPPGKPTLPRNSRPHDQALLTIGFP